MQKRMAHDIDGNLFPTAQHQSVVISEIPNVGDAAHERFNDNRKRPRPILFENVAQITSREKHNLRNGVVQPFDFTTVNWLDLPPELANLLLTVVTRKDLTKTLEGNH